MRIASLAPAALAALLWCQAARADYEYRYIESEKPSATADSGLRNEGFTSWMRQPSHHAVMVLFGSGWLEYDVRGLGEGPYHVFVRGLAWASGADVDVYWDGVKVGHPRYTEPSTALKWSRAVGVVRGPGDHKLRIANDPANPQAPYIDVVLLTSQEGYQPPPEDQDFASFSTPLPLLRVREGERTLTVPGQPDAQGDPELALEVLDARMALPGIGRNTVALRVRDTRGQGRRLALSARLGKGPEAPVAATVPAGGEQEIRVPCEAIAPGKQPLALRIAEAGRTLLAGGYRVRVADPAAMSLDEYAYPVGRGRATWRAAFTCAPEIASEVRATVSLLRRSDGRVLQERELRGAHPGLSAAFDLSALPLDRYAVRARFTRRGRPMCEETRELALFRPAPVERWEPVRRVEARGDTLYLNGKPFLPRLLYHAAANAATRNHGFNLVQCFGDDPDPRTSIRGHLDACAKTGLWGTVALFNNRYFLPGSRFDLEHLREVVLRFRNHPALFCWDLIDEPEATITPAHTAEAAKLIRELDPNHPVWVNLCRPDRGTDYLESQDIWSFDHYPLPIPGPMAYMDWFGISDKKVRGTRPIGTALQTFGPDLSAMPTPDELRNTAYLHVIHGYKWFGCYSYNEGEPYGCLARHPVLWSYTRALNAELRALAPAILDPAAVEPVKASVGAERFQVGLKRSRGGTYLFAVNGTRQAMQVRMAVPGKAAGVLFEAQRTLPIRAGTLEDRFGPYAVHVYRIRTGG